MSCCDSKSSSPSSTGGTCAPGALNGGLVRTRFFDGMILTQADLENEQRYWRLKRRLTNRALGQGVVWGLRARWDNLRNVIALGPGYALDCCGNDLVVECATEQSLADLWNRADPLIKARDPASFSRASVYLANNQPRLTTACLVLQYVECPQDARPVQTDACTPPSSRCESSRIRETTRLAFVPPPPPPPPNCLEDLFADLEQIKLSITDIELRNQIFPPAAQPSTTPAADATLPLTLTVTTPGFSTGSTPSAATITPLANGTTNGPPVIVATRVPSGLTAGLVQFEMRPVADWGFYQGQVKDGDAVVDMVAPPLDLQQFWALEIALSENIPSATKSFTYSVDALGLEQMFGTRAKGLASLTISGRVTATRNQAGGVETRVEGLSVTAQSAVGEASTSGSCFDVLRWGFMADPAHGADDVKVLLLAAIYAYFADLSARSGGASTQQLTVAALIYIVAWRLLGVNLVPATDAQRQELGRVLARLFECWCNAMLYPGPRCATEDHGVVLGTATFTLNGQLVGFDMWENRREVITGPLINHWLGVFGFAPIDVVANRIAQAICCISGLQIPVIPGRNDTGGIGVTVTHVTSDSVGVPLGSGNVVVGRASDAAATDVSPTSLVGHMVSALVGAHSTPLATFRSRLANGTVVEVTAPAATGATVASTGSIATSVDPIVRGLAPALSPINRSVVARATSELAREVPATAVAELSAPASELAKSLGTMTVAGLVEAGPEGVLAKAPSADPAAVDELLAKADTTLGQLAESAAAATRKTKVGKPSAMLREPALRKALTADLTKKFDLAKTAVDRALERAASQTT